MVSLHGVWWHSRLHLWGEDAVDLDGVPTHRPEAPTSSERPNDGRPHVGDTAHEHPTALTAAELHAAVGEVSSDGLLASIAAESSITLWLPCVGGLPVSSSVAATSPADEANGRDADADVGTLQRVRVPTLSFSAAETVDLLLDLPVPWLASSSQSLRYWWALARLVLALLARQQFVPDVEEAADGTHRARWRLFVRNRAVLAWLERYTTDMPAVCRAVAAGDNAATEPVKVVDSFLLETADALIRRILSNDPFFEQIRHRATGHSGLGLRWVAALIGENHVVRGAPEELAELAVQVHSWIGQLEQGEQEAPPELGFALLEPAEGVALTDPRWRVRFDLNSSEAGTALDVRAVWADRDVGPTVLGRHLVNRRQHLTAALRRAAEVFPPLKHALAADAPTDLELSTDEAHAFIHEWAPMLRAQGFGAAVPAWAEERRSRLGIELFVQPFEQGDDDASSAITSLGLNSLLAFDWRIALGDEHLSLDEIEGLAKEGPPLVNIRGHWVDVDRRSAAQALTFLRRQPRGRIALAEAIRLGSGAADLETGLPILGLRGASWLERLLDDAPDERMPALEQPSAFCGTLRPYQRAGLEWLSFLDRLGIGACLADDMGLGKTIQLIALMLHERREANDVGPTLLFAPMSVVGNWEREIQRFAPLLRVLVHHGPERLLGDAFVRAAGEHDVVMTTYGLAQRDFKTLSRVAWHRIALDEAQKIKNPSANQTLAIRSLVSRHRVALTGTPVENHLSDLWSIMEMLNPGALGSAASFRRRFVIPIEKLGDQDRSEQLRRMIRPFVLRRLKSDPKVACDLPEKMEMRVYCNLTPEQAACYEQTVNRLLNEVDQATGVRRRGLILATLTKLKQVCNHPSQLLRDGGPLDRRSGKCERLVEMLEEVLAEGDAALVFTQFRVMGDLLLRLLTNRLRVEIPFLHGGTSRKARDNMINNFQDPTSRARIFLLSLKAGGFGVNLTRANHVFHFDRWWNPAVEEQATDRAHRIGQTRRVQVHKFVCIGTIEDRIDEILTQKAKLADRIVGRGDEWLTSLSTRELRECLALSREAVSET